VPEFPPKVEAALNAGEAWKARDLLRGRISSSPYTADLYEQMGVVLLRMGDVPEAGKYLFLSGRQKPDYEPAVGVFLRRYGRSGWRQLVAAFPASARKAPLGALPEPVKRALEERGFGASEGRRRGTVSLARAIKAAESRKSTVGCVVWGVLGLLGALALARSLVHFFWPAP
jgi:hypothetical protein